MGNPFNDENLTPADLAMIRKAAREFRVPDLAAYHRAKSLRLLPYQSEAAEAHYANMRKIMAYAIADGFTEGNEPFNKASEMLQLRYGHAADAVLRELAALQADSPTPAPNLGPSMTFSEWFNAGPEIAKEAGFAVEIVAVTALGNTLKLTSADFDERASPAPSLRGEVGDLRDQRNDLVSKGIDPNLDSLPWRPIAEADNGIAYIHDLVGLKIGCSYPIWVRDADGRVYEALWSDNGKKAYWWDIEGESPVDPVEFMPHPLAALSAAATEGE